MQYKKCTQCSRVLNTTDGTWTSIESLKPGTPVSDKVYLSQQCLMTYATRAKIRNPDILKTMGSNLPEQCK